MKARKINFKKGNRYANNQLKKLFLGVLTIFAVVFLAGIFMEPDFILNMGGFCTTQAMSMMLIGDIKDVSDRQTHGANIAYQVYLINLDQIDNNVRFPKPNANREVGQIPMKAGEYMRYFEAHDIPTYTGTGEKGDITTSGENVFTIIMGGMRDQLLNFQEEYAGGKFIVLFHEIREDDWYILGSYDRPLIFSSFENKNDKDGRYVTYTFKRTSIDQYYKYVGAIIKSEAGAHAADSAILSLKAGIDVYTIPSGGSGPYAITGVSGITASDKGRYITLEGTGMGDASAIIADSDVFILEDGTAWTAKAGSRITFRVMDATTLVEVEGSRVQTA